MILIVFQTCKMFQNDNLRDLKRNVLNMGIWIVLASLYAPITYVAFLNVEGCFDDASSPRQFSKCQFFGNFDYRTYCFYPNICIVFVTLITAKLI